MNSLFNKLNELINKYDKFIVMGHQNPDLDALGSAFGICEILKSLNKESYVFLDINNISKYNDTVINAISNIKGKINFINKNDYKKIIDNSTLLIVIDVHQKERIEYPEILSEDIDVIVLDHHMKTKNYIDNTILTYIDTNLSSMNELVAYYAKSLNFKLNPIIATIMLAGIEVDTNSYNLRTTDNTYKASGFLMTMGADTILKQELLKETIDEYLKRAGAIKTSFMINGNVAMCILPGKVTKEELAETADELLKFVDVEASFAIGKFNYKTVCVSARSLGNLDVEVIMKHFSGGGTLTNAAAQIENKSVREIKQEIINLIK